jgi:hypothetical protein
LGEFVAIADEISPAVDGELATDFEVTHINVHIILFLRTMSPKESSLRNARILLARFENLEGVVLEEKEDDYMTNPEVLLLAAEDGLLEIAIEPKNLRPECNPGWNGLPGLAVSAESLIIY